MPQSTLNLVDYHRWAYRCLGRTLSTLSPDMLSLPLGLFFGSILGTLNHLLVVDELWVARLQGRSPRWPDLDSAPMDNVQVLLAELDDLADALQDVVRAERLSPSFKALRNSDGETLPFSFEEVIQHLVNHSTHHRGQISAGLTRLGFEPPAMDFYYFLLDR